MHTDDPTKDCLDKLSTSMKNMVSPSTEPNTLAVSRLTIPLNRPHGFGWGPKGARCNSIPQPASKSEDLPEQIPVEIVEAL